MITVLILEDDVPKLTKILNVLDGQRIPKEMIRCVGTTFDAENELRENLFDLLILDINVPLREDADATRRGGETLLRDICAKRKDIKPPAYIVGITAYKDLKGEVQPTFEDLQWHVLHYDPTSDDWSKKLVEKVSHILSCKKEEGKKIKEQGGYKYDIAVITALESELTAVRSLPLDWQLVKNDNADDTIYHESILEIDGKRITIICAAATQMGMSHSAVLSSKIIHYYRPRYLWMLGMCAGIKSEVNLGDIIVVDSCWDYGNGKFKEDKEGKLFFEQSPVQYPLDPSMRARISLLTTKPEFSQNIKSGYKEKAPEHPLRIVLGPLASGAAVVASEQYLDLPKQQNRKLLGIEMEAYGVMCAGANSGNPKPITIVAKSVCDFGDAEKADKAQNYATYTSANFFYNFIKQYMFL